MSGPVPGGVAAAFAWGDYALWRSRGRPWHDWHVIVLLLPAIAAGVWVAVGALVLDAGLTREQLLAEAVGPGARPSTTSYASCWTTSTCRGQSTERSPAVAGPRAPWSRSWPWTDAPATGDHGQAAHRPRRCSRHAVRPPSAPLPRCSRGRRRCHRGGGPGPVGRRGSRDAHRLVGDGRADDPAPASRPARPHRLEHPGDRGARSGLVDQPRVAERVAARGRRPVAAHARPGPRPDRAGTASPGPSSGCRTPARPPPERSGCCAASASPGRPA